MCNHCYHLFPAVVIKGCSWLLLLMGGTSPYAYSTLFEAMHYMSYYTWSTRVLGGGVAKSKPFH